MEEKYDCVYDGDYSIKKHLQLVTKESNANVKRTVRKKYLICVNKRIERLEKMISKYKSLSDAKKLESCIIEYLVSILDGNKELNLNIVKGCGDLIADRGLIYFFHRRADPNYAKDDKCYDEKEDPDDPCDIDDM